MANPNGFRNLRQQIQSDSASWGSLAVLAIGVMMIVILMVFYSHS